MRLAAAVSTLLLVTLAACDTTLEPDADVALPDQGVDVVADQQLPDQQLPDQQLADQTLIDHFPASGFKVAGVQYHWSNITSVGSCTSNPCAIEQLVTDAAQKGAGLVVLPDNVFNHMTTPAMPLVGDKPATDPKYPLTSHIKDMAQLADNLNIIVVFTHFQETPGSQKLYDVSLAIDGSGTIIARHFKFQLNSPSEDNFTAGTSVAESCFDTPAGRACMLAGMDVGCVVLNMNSSASSCWAQAVPLLKDIEAEKPTIVLFSAWWLAAGANPTWQILNVMQKIATHFGAWVVGANTTLAPGQGGGIWKPNGSPVDTHSANTPKVVLGLIP